MTIKIPAGDIGTVYVYRKSRFIPQRFYYLSPSIVKAFNFCKTDCDQQQSSISKRMNRASEETLTIGQERIKTISIEIFVIRQRILFQLLSLYVNTWDRKKIYWHILWVLSTVAGSKTLSPTRFRNHENLNNGLPGCYVYLLRVEQKGQ